MKRLFTFLVTMVACVCCIISLSSCNSDEKTSNPLIGKWEKPNGNYESYYTIEFLNNGVCIEYHAYDQIVWRDPDDEWNYTTETEEEMNKYKYEILDENRVALLDFETEQLDRDPKEFEVIGNTLILGGEEYIKVR